MYNCRLPFVSIFENFSIRSSLTQCHCLIEILQWWFANCKHNCVRPRRGVLFSHRPRNVQSTYIWTGRNTYQIQRRWRFGANQVTNTSNYIFVYLDYCLLVLLITIKYIIVILLDILQKIFIMVRVFCSQLSIILNTFI